MLQKNELRIGNVLVHPLKDGKIFVIRSGADIDEIYKMQELKGYPIHYGILEKCGFQESESNNEPLRSIWGVQIANVSALYYDPLGDEFAPWYISQEWSHTHRYAELWNQPKYLHQVQNLVFALSGEELKVNL
jgi:hypothetical protein